MTDPNQIAERYLNTWNAEPSERAAALEHWSPDATYIDPLMSGRSREGIGTMIEAAVAQFPGHSFALDGKPDGHGPHARLRWTLAPSTGEAIAHLRYLERAGRATVEMRDGVGWYSSA